MRHALFALVLLSSLPALAQNDALTERGTLVIGGTAGLSRTSTDQISSTNVFASPRLGTFVADGLAVGLGLGVRHTTSKQTTTIAGEDVGFEFDATSLSATPFVTYYIGDPGASVLPFVSTSAGVVYERTQSLSFDSPRITAYDTYIAGDVAAGALVRLGTNVGLTGEGYYRWGTEGAPTDDYGLRGGIAVFLGR